jgi:PAS domain S-box-containing protein
MPGHDRALVSTQGSDLARALFHEAGDALFIVDPRSQQVLAVNPMALKLTRLSREALLQFSYREVIRHLRNADDWHDSVRQTILFHGQDGFLLRTDRADVWVPVSVSISRLHVAGCEPLALFTVRDRTEQMAAHRRLHRAETELRRVLVSVSDCLWSSRIDEHGQWHYRYLSPVVERITGHPVSYFLEDARGWEQVVDPVDLPHWHQFAARVRGGETAEIEYRIQKADGSTAWLRESVVASPANAPGSPMLLHGVLTDITERRRAEQATLERNLLQTQRLESLGVLAGGVAHDFNNLLTGILGNAGLARMGCPSGSPLHGPLEQIEAIALRAAELCQQMLAYAGKGSLQPIALNLNDVLRETMELVRLSLSNKATLTFELAPSLPCVWADVGQSRQVITNLVLNASEALGTREGRIRVATGILHRQPGSTEVEVFGGQLAEGEYVYLEVADDGEGMSTAVKARMFEPFFSTRFTGRGLGLPVVLGIVRGHQGALRVDSEVGVGTTVRVFLPYAPTAGTPRLNRLAQ